MERRRSLTGWRSTGHTVRVSEANPTRELMEEEDRLWVELHALVRSLPASKVDTPGYFEEGWSAKDLVAHIGNWLAEAGVVLERIRFGTYRADEIDIDAMNKQFYEAMRDVPFETVRAQASAARTRMLRAWGSLERRHARQRAVDPQIRARALRRAPASPSGMGGLAHRLTLPAAGNIVHRRSEDSSPGISVVDMGVGRIRR